jgi:hypothetical protein
MKKIAFIFFCILALVSTAEAQNKVRAYTALTGGGTGALDKTAVAELADGDIAMVVTATDLYFYSFDATATDAESSPLFIRPNDYSTEGVWKLVSFNALAYRSSGTESYLTLATQASRAPTASAYEIYVEGGYWRVNHNGTEMTYFPYDEIVVTVYKPNSLDDAQRDHFWIWKNTSGKTFKVTGWYGISTADDTDLLIREEDADGQNDVTVDSVTIATNGTGLYYGSDTTITADTIEDGHLLYLDFDDTDDPAMVTIIIKGYYY